MTTAARTRPARTFCVWTWFAGACRRGVWVFLATDYAAHTRNYGILDSCAGDRLQGRRPPPRTAPDRPYPFQVTEIPSNTILHKPLKIAVSVVFSHRYRSAGRSVKNPREQTGINPSEYGYVPHSNDRPVWKGLARSAEVAISSIQRQHAKRADGA